MKKLSIAVAMMLLFMLPGIAQEFSLSGTVFNESGETLPGATIQIKKVGKVAISGPKGHYKLALDQRGTYEVHIRYVGYAELVRQVSVQKAESVDFYMSPSALISEVVLVRGIRAGAKDPAVFTELSAANIQEDNRVQDIPYLLEMTPSLVATSDAGTGIGYTGLRIRGTDPSRINVTINGIPYNDSESHDVYWVDIPDISSSSASIQVQRGLGTSTNGAAAFGANISLETRKLNHLPYASLDLAAGSFNTLRNSISVGSGLIDGQFTFDFRRSALTTDGYIDRAWAKMNSFYLSGAWYRSKSILSVHVFNGQELTYQAWGGVPAELLESDRTFNPYTYENEVDDYEQTHYQLHWSYELSKQLNLNLAGHYTRGAGYYEQFREDESFSDYLLDPLFLSQDTLYSTDLVRRKWLDNHFYGLTYNLNYASSRLEVLLGGAVNQYDGDHYGRIVWAEYSSNSNPFSNYYFSNGLKKEWNNYVKVNYEAAAHLYVYGDLQYRVIDYRIDGVDDDQRDITQNHQYHFLNPKVGLMYNPRENSGWYTSLGLGNREPKRSNFTDAAPGTEVRPEQMTDLELGYFYRPGKYRFGINLYWMNYKDQLVLTGEINDVGSAIMVNVPESYRAGIELEGGIKIGQKLDWMANLTLSRNRILNFTEYVDDWDTWDQQVIELGETHLAFSPGIIAGSRLSYQVLSDLKLSLDTKVVGKQFMDNTSSVDKMLESYWVNDLMLTYTPSLNGKSRLTLFVQVNNVLDHLYESNAWVYSYFYEGQRAHMIGYYPQAGRHFLAGMSLNF